MRLSRLALMKALGWMGVLVLIAVAAAVAMWVSFGGLFLFGLAGGLICDRLKRDEASSATPQDSEIEQIDFLAQLRVIRWCSFAAMAIGLFGLTWKFHKP